MSLPESSLGADCSQTLYVYYGVSVPVLIPILSCTKSVILKPSGICIFTFQKLEFKDGGGAGRGGYPSLFKQERFPGQATRPPVWGGEG